MCSAVEDLMQENVRQQRFQRLKVHGINESWLETLPSVFTGVWEERQGKGKSWAKAAEEGELFCYYMFLYCGENVQLHSMLIETHFSARDEILIIKIIKLPIY